MLLISFDLIVIDWDLSCCGLKFWFSASVCWVISFISEVIDVKCGMIGYLNFGNLGSNLYDDLDFSYSLCPSLDHWHELFYFECTCLSTTSKKNQNLIVYYKYLSSFLSVSVYPLPARRIRTLLFIINIFRFDCIILRYLWKYVLLSKSVDTIFVEFRHQFSWFLRSSFSPFIWLFSLCTGIFWIVVV